MIKGTKDERIRTFKWWIETIINEGRNVTKWEENFAYSLDEQLEQGRDLSEKQEEILERIYSEKTPT